MTVPLIFIGCPSVLEPFLPLQNRELRASVSDYGSFDSPDVSVVRDGATYVMRAPVLGTDGADTLVFTLVVPIQISTPYTINVSANSSALIEYCVQQTKSLCTVYDAKQGVGSGSITVNNITASGSTQVIEGTFSGTVVASSGASKEVTNGEFKVVYP